MKRSGPVRCGATIALILMLLGCARLRVGEEGKMENLAGRLVKLTAAVEATVRYGEPPAGIGDRELLRIATKLDPTLLWEFADYSIRIARRHRHAIVLICTGDGKRALLEDAGSAPESVRRLWKEQPPRPCEFTLSIEDLCGRQ